MLHPDIIDFDHNPIDRNRQTRPFFIPFCDKGPNFFKRIGQVNIRGHMEAPFFSFHQVSVMGFRHAANTFALAMFMSLVFRNKRFTVMMFSWAVVVSYSRMYLGVHYFGDLFCGASVGSLFAVLFYSLLKFLCEKLKI